MLHRVAVDVTGQRDFAPGQRVALPGARSTFSDSAEVEFGCFTCSPTRPLSPIHSPRVYVTPAKAEGYPARSITIRRSERESISVRRHSHDSSHPVNVVFAAAAVYTVSIYFRFYSADLFCIGFFLFIFSLGVVWVSTFGSWPEGNPVVSRSLCGHHLSLLFLGRPFFCLAVCSLCFGVDGGHLSGQSYRSNSRSDFGTTWSHLRRTHIVFLTF